VEVVSPLGDPFGVHVSLSVPTLARVESHLCSLVLDGQKGIKYTRAGRERIYYRVDCSSAHVGRLVGNRTGSRCGQIDRR